MREIAWLSGRAGRFSLMLATASVLAQESTTGPTTLPATAPAAVSDSSTMPARSGGLPATRPYDPNATVVFNFKDAAVESVLDHLSESLGFIIIKDGRIDGRITMTSRQAVGADDAVELLNSVLKPLNYTAIRTGRVLRVISRDKAKKANIPVRIGADPEQIAATDELITQVIPLAQVDATKLRQDLQPLFSPEADVTSNAGSNTIIITDASSSIRRIVEVISAMDRAMATTSDLKVFQLQNAAASNVAKLINDLFKQDQAGAPQQQGGQGFRRFGGGGFPGMPGGFPGMPGAPAGSADVAAARGKVNAVADDRTNMVVVSGPAATLTLISSVIRDLDGNPAQQTIVKTYPLRNAQATRVANVLNSLFGVSGALGASSGSSTSTRQPFGGFSSSTGIGGGMFGGGAFGGGFSGGRGGYGNALSNFFGGTGTTVSSNARAIASELTGQVFVVADSDTNSLLVTTSPKYSSRVEEIIREMDRSLPQVLIKVLFAEVTHTDNTDIGVQASILFQNDTGDGERLGTDFGLANQTGGMVVSVVESNFTAKLRALQTQGKLDVLSRPYILTADNQLASILVGQQVPLIANSRITDTGQTINSINYQDIGIILNVTPHINPDGKVIMDVSPEISSQAPDSSIEISPGVFAPVFNKRTAQSRVAIDNGHTIVIGGLMEDKKTQTVDKVPLLGDIPYAGALFRRTHDAKSKTELLIFLTPHVVRESSTLTGISKDEMKGVKIIPDAVSPGTFVEHLNGMQRGATTQPAEPIYVPPPPTTEPARKSK